MRNKEFGLNKEDRKTLIEVFSKFPEVEEVMIFGSRVLGNYINSSDIDLVLKGNVESIYLFIKSILNEETLLPYHFDVYDYKKITNKKLKNHIDNFGKSIYKST